MILSVGGLTQAQGCGNLRDDLLPDWATLDK
jgi:hypothetical protein